MKNIAGSCLENFQTKITGTEVDRECSRHRVAGCIHVAGFADRQDIAGAECRSRVIRRTVEFAGYTVVEDFLIGVGTRAKACTEECCAGEGAFTGDAREDEEGAGNRCTVRDCKIISGECASGRNI